MWLALIATLAVASDEHQGAACALPHSFGDPSLASAPNGIPAVDLHQPVHTEIATFALG
jgi:hypothetical protein